MGRNNSKKSKTKKAKGGEEGYKGKLEITRSGMGFVVVQGVETDILVRPGDFNTAMHGDTVRVSIQPTREGKRAQGRVIEVVERKQTEFIGKLQMNNGYAFFVAEGSKKMPDIFIQEFNKSNANYKSS